jgi:hypothetical protein
VYNKLTNYSRRFLYENTKRRLSTFVTERDKANYFSLSGFTVSPKNTLLILYIISSFTLLRDMQTLRSPL